MPDLQAFLYGPSAIKYCWHTFSPAHDYVEFWLFQGACRGEVGLGTGREVLQGELLLLGLDG